MGHGHPKKSETLGDTARDPRAQRSRDEWERKAGRVGNGWESRNKRQASLGHSGAEMAEWQGYGPGSVMSLGPITTRRRRSIRQPPRHKQPALSVLDAQELVSEQAARGILPNGAKAFHLRQVPVRRGFGALWVVWPRECYFISHLKWPFLLFHNQTRIAHTCAHACAQRRTRQAISATRDPCFASVCFSHSKSLTSHVSSLQRSGFLGA
jgi:hypothetical protein